MIREKNIIMVIFYRKVMFLRGNHKKESSDFSFQKMYKH